MTEFNDNAPLDQMLAERSAYSECTLKASAEHPNSRRMMRRLLSILLLILTTGVSAQPAGTVRAQMDRIETAFDVHFVYDSGLPVEQPSKVTVNPQKSLRQNLTALFRGTGIDWSIKKKYVVLTRINEVSSRPLPVTPPVVTFETDTIVAASITGHIDRDMNFTQTGLTKLDGAAFQRAFAVFSTPDVLKTLQALPGVASGTELLSNLYVHGGDGSDNLFLLDGVPLYQICHLGGIFSAFNTDAIETLDFYKSGFPARFGGRTSSVVDITTKDGSFQDYKGLFSIGLLESRLQFEGPVVKERTSFNIALRRSWADAVLYPVCWFNNRNVPTTNNWYGYAFTDLNVKLTHKLSDQSRLSAHLYVGSDRFKWEQLSAWRLTAPDADGIERSSQHQDTTRVLLRWGNVLLSAHWDKDLSDKMHLHLSGYGSGTRSRTDYLYGESFLDGLMDREDTQEQIQGRGILDDLGLTAHLDWRLRNGHHFRFGGNAIRHNYRPRFAYSENRVVIDGDSIRTAAYEASVYAEDEIRVSRRLTANAGLRNTLYYVDGHAWNSLEPRLALKFQCAPFLSFKASYAAMSQFSHQAATTYLDLPTNTWLPSCALIPPMRSRQVAGGIFVRLPNAMHLNVEGWWKRMDNLIEYNGMNSFFPRVSNWEQGFKTGKGRSYGLETDFGYETPQLTVNFFYTLSWNERFFADSWPDWYRDRNDNRHKLTWQANWRINEKWELYGAWHYHSGNRISVASQYVQGIYIQPDNFYIHDPQTGERVPASAGRWVYEKPNNVKLPDYHRLDIGINRHRKTRRGNEVVWNFSVYNVYCRLNLLYAVVKIKGNEYPGDQRYQDMDAVSFVAQGYGIIPIVPTLSYTLKF
ncbi:MAG: TonB-dependent receptor plug domain-containing protein [Bacteroidales bacterium]|nr:TonB-dependent receptor plug domain-containing protein [Bacteroidales bacterium]